MVRRLIALTALVIAVASGGCKRDPDRCIEGQRRCDGNVLFECLRYCSYSCDPADWHATACGDSGLVCEGGDAASGARCAAVDGGASGAIDSGAIDLGAIDSGAIDSGGQID